MRTDFGLVSGHMRDSGLGISLFRLLQVPRKVPHGLMQGDDGSLFLGLGLILGDSGQGNLVQHRPSAVSSWLAHDFRGPPGGGPEKNS